MTKAGPHQHSSTRHEVSCLHVFDQAGPSTQKALPHLHMKILLNPPKIDSKAIISIARGFPGGSVIKNLPAKQEIWVQFLGWEDSLEKEMALTPVFLGFPGGSDGKASVFLPGDSHGQRSLASYTPWDHRRVGHDLVTTQQQSIARAESLLLVHAPTAPGHTALTTSHTQVHRKTLMSYVYPPLPNPHSHLLSCEILMAGTESYSSLDPLPELGNI